MRSLLTYFYYLLFAAVLLPFCSRGQSGAQQVVSLQYFFDNDPGQGVPGNGAIISLTPADTLNQLFNLPLPTGLSEGFHHLYVRVMDVNGRWSQTERRSFFINSSALLPENIVSLQYFFDSDPGTGQAGNGAVVSLVPTLNYSATQIIPVPSSITSGFHTLFIRMMDSGGQWSQTERRLFYVTNSLALPDEIVAYQYFFDSDPGVDVPGNGAVVPIAPTLSYSSLEPVPVPSSLTEGFHTLFIRVKDSGGQWSQAERRSFYISSSLQLAEPIEAYQYYFDTDPGVGNAGNGGIVQFTQTFNYASIEPVPVPSNLSPGLHHLYIRVKDTGGQWSQIQRKLFYINDSSIVTNDIAALEYFFDTDPGQGLANPYSITPGATVNLIAGVSLPCLSSGTHYLYVRARDTGGRWSLIQRDTFLVDTGAAQAVVTAVGPLTICAGDSTVLTSTSVQGATYQWTRNGIDIDGANDTLLVVDTAGSYTLKVYCGSSFSASNTVHVSTVPILVYYADTDGDGYGDRDSTESACQPSAGFVIDSTDCNDQSSAVYPGNTEICNYIDDDCDAVTDEGLLLNFYRDNDGDGFGESLQDTAVCTAPSGYVSVSGDCDDQDALIYPDAQENCGNGKDDNCNGQIDEGPFVFAGPYQEVCDTIAVLNGSDPLDGTGIWSLISGSGVIANPQQRNAVVTGLSSGPNLFRWTVSRGTCVAFAEVTIISNQNPIVDFNGLKASYCLNEPAVQLTGLPAGGIFSGTGISGNTFTPATTGVISIQYISAPFGGCPADTVLKTTTVNPLPTIQISASPDPVLCIGDSVNLFSTGSQGDIVWNSGVIATSYYTSTPGVYAATVTDANGCTSVSNSLSLTAVILPKIQINGSTSICAGQSRTLSINSSSIVWNNGSTAPVIVVNPAVTTLYSVSGLSTDGCVFSDSILITVNPVQLPGAVTNMLPADGSTGLNYPLTLSWLPGTLNTAFDLYVWPTSQAQPSTPYASNLTSFNYTFYSGLGYGTLYNWRIVSKNGNCFSTQGPVHQLTMRNLPDLIVPNVQTIANAVQSQHISVTWEVENVGTGTSGTQGWTDVVYLSTDTIFNNGIDIQLGAYPNFSALLSGQSYSQSATIQLPSNVLGLYYLLVRSDVFTQLQESNEINNTGYTPIPINIILGPKPDLRVASIAHQSFAFSGDVIPVTYTVKNFGDQAVNAYLLRQQNVPVTYTSGNISTPFFFYNFRVKGWKDGLQISQSPFAGSLANREYTLFDYPADLLNYSNSPGFTDTTGYYLNNLNDPGPLLMPDSTYTVTRYLKVPNYVYGPHYIFVNTDGEDRFDEGPFEANNQNSSTITVFLTPPPDLRITAVNSPSSASAAQIVNISYTGSNFGLSATDTSWKDFIYLSSSPTFNNQLAVKVGESPLLTMAVPPGGIYTNQVAVSIPDTMQGPYYVYVLADARNEVFEFDKENNNIHRSVSTMTVSRPDLSVANVVVPATASAGTLMTLKWDDVNNGPGQLTARSRMDAIYLSPSSVFNPSTAISIDTAVFNDPLGAGNTVARQKNISLPPGLSGNYYLFIKTDNGNTIAETTENNNINAAGAPLLIGISLWADLASTVLPISDSLLTYSTISIAYEVRNAGTLQASGQWNDRLYLSSSPVLNAGNALLIKNYPQNRLLPPGSNYTVNDVIVLPSVNQIPGAVPNGTVYFHIWSDISNTIFENGVEVNNISTSTSSVIYNHFVDHIVEQVGVFNDTIEAGLTSNFSWTVRNIGGVTNSSLYNQWPDALYLSTDTVWNPGDVQMDVVYITTPLLNNATYSRQRTCVIPYLPTGNYYLIAATDINGSISGEQVKTNNSNLHRNSNGAPQAIHLVTSPPPDLIVSAVNTPISGLSGQPLSIVYSVSNSGSGYTQANTWKDVIYLSADYTIDAGDYLIDQRTHTGTLFPGETYTDTVATSIPVNVPSGNYVLIVKTDHTGVVNEAANEGNNQAFSFLSVVQPPPSDLVVDSIFFPDTAVTGTAVVFNWQVRNRGSNPATGTATEAVYLSRDTVWDLSDALVGTAPVFLNLPPGGTAPHQMTRVLQNVVQGANHVLVKTDLLNNIPEQNEANNTTVRIDRTMEVLMKQLPLNVHTPDVLSVNTVLNYGISIPPSLVGQTLLITLTGAASQASNEIYLSFEKVPTRAVHDFSYSDPGAANQQIIVPVLQSGTYYLSVYGQALNGAPQPVDLYATILPFSVLSVDASRGGNTGSVTVKIEGSKFNTGMQAKLIGNGGATVITAIRVSYINSTKVFATFNLNQKPLGTYDVVLVKQDSSTAALPNSFVIEPGNSGGFYIGGLNNSGMSGEPDAPGCDPGMTAGSNSGLQLDIILPASVRFGATVPLLIQFGNAGNVDIPIPTRILTSTFRAQLSNVIDANGLPISLDVQGLGDNKKEIYLEFREPNGPLDVLRAGTTSGITFYTKANRRGRAIFKLK